MKWAHLQIEERKLLFEEMKFTLFLCIFFFPTNKVVSNLGYLIA